MTAPSPEVLREALSAVVIGGGLGIIAAFQKARDEFNKATARRVVIRAGSPEQYRKLCARDRGAK